MHLISVLLPLFDNDGDALPRDLFSEVAAELTSKFGGLTAHTRAPAKGMWQPAKDDRPMRDDIVIYEVVVESIDRAWWSDYRGQLERRFRQDTVLIRGQQVELL